MTPPPPPLSMYNIEKQETQNRMDLLERSFFFAAVNSVQIRYGSSVPSLIVDCCCILRCRRCQVLSANSHIQRPQDSYQDH